MPKTKSLLLLLYQLWKTAVLRSFSMYCKCKDRPTFGALSNQGLCHFCSAANTTEKLSEINLEEKIKFFGLWKNTYHTIFIYGKKFIIEISYNFLYVWHCMELYDKKFLIYGNCMIRSFGHPGYPCFYRVPRSTADIFESNPRSLGKSLPVIRVQSFQSKRKTTQTMNLQHFFPNPNKNVTKTLSFNYDRSSIKLNTFNWPKLSISIVLALSGSIGKFWLAS